MIAVVVVGEKNVTIAGWDGESTRMILQHDVGKVVVVCTDALELDG